MKKIILLLAITMSAMFSLRAQTVRGSFAALKDISRVRLEIDFTQAFICGMTEDEFAVYEKDWEKDQPEIVSRFMTECNKKCGNGVYVGLYRESPYLIRIIVHSISSDGDWDCDAFLVDAEGSEVAAILNLRESGGKFGTKLNLIKDGAAHTGELFGILLKRAIKKEK